MARKEIKAPLNNLNDKKDASLRRDSLHSLMTSRSSESNREGINDWNSTISSKPTKSTSKRKIEVNLLEDEENGNGRDTPKKGYTQFFHDQQKFLVKP
jgi:hypothetical protein